MLKMQCNETLTIVSGFRIMLPILVAQLIKDWEAHPPLPSSPKNNHRLKSLPHSSQCRPSAETIRKTPTQRNNSKSPVVQHAHPGTNTISDSEGCYARHMVVNNLFDSAVKRTIMKENIANALSVNESGGNVTAKVISGISCHPAVSS
ncbi:hypothetical protein T07_14490 [Trichinella nelsoni]|uniref:Uncharacterized protein n=1 Tax=Trichinella nelsoni TaxID=6336 RepID=A0A0V0RGV2_9BILA|nr:hypothetical protein T07_14490 [Trichinella nelsoni]